MLRVALVLLVAALLAGCSSPASVPTPTGPAPAATPTEAPSPAMPTVEADTGVVRLVALNVTPALVDVGLPVTLVATVANDGPGPGRAEVRFSIGGAPEVSVLQTGILEGGTREVFSDLTQGAVGNFTAQARLGNDTRTAAFEVVGPRIAHLDFRASAPEPCGPVSVRSSFWNLGTGRARDVHADLQIMDTAGLLLADFTTRIGDVAAGQLAESEGVVEEVKGVCGGEEPKPYRFRLLVRAEGVTETTITGAFVA